MKMSPDAARLLADFTAAHFKLNPFDDVVVRSGAWEMVAKIPRDLDTASIVDQSNFLKFFGGENPDGRLYVLDLSAEISIHAVLPKIEALCVPRTWAALSELQDRLIEQDGFMVDLIVFDESLAHALVRRLESVVLFRLVGFDAKTETVS